MAKKMTDVAKKYTDEQLIECVKDMPLRQVFQDGVSYGMEHKDEQYDLEKYEEAFLRSKQRYLHGWKE